MDNINEFLDMIRNNHIIIGLTANDCLYGFIISDMNNSLKLFNTDYKKIGYKKFHSKNINEILKQMHEWENEILFTMNIDMILRDGYYE
jgi:hypothetical protein